MVSSYKDDFQIKKETLQNIQNRISTVLKKHPQDHDKIDCVILEWDPSEEKVNNSEKKIKQVMDMANNFLQKQENISEYQINQSMEYIKDSLSEKKIKPIVNIMWPIGPQMPGFFARDKDEDLKNDEAMAVYYLVLGLVGHDDRCRQNSDGQIIIKAVDMLDIIVKRLLDMGGSFSGGVLL